jgi:hypothetical protein
MWRREASAEEDSGPQHPKSSSTPDPWPPARACSAAGEGAARGCDPRIAREPAPLGLRCWMRAGTVASRPCRRRRLGGGAFPCSGTECPGPRAVKPWRRVRDDDDRGAWARELDGGGANFTPRWWSFSAAVMERPYAEGTRGRGSWRGQQRDFASMLLEIGFSAWVMQYCRQCKLLDASPILPQLVGVSLRYVQRVYKTCLCLRNFAKKNPCAVTGGASSRDS